MVVMPPVSQKFEVALQFAGELTIPHTEAIGIVVELPAGSPALNEGQGDPVDVADTCVFLASDLGRHVSGVEIFVDGAASLLR